MPSDASARVPAASPGDAFPLVAGARYSFVGSFHGKTSTTELELRAVDGQGEKVFHFAEVASASKLVAPTFGLGAFVARADGLYTADALRADDLPSIPKSAFHKLVGLPAKVGAVEKAIVPAKGIVPGIAQTYRVGAIEPVTVPAGTFEGCVRLDIETIIDGEKDVSSVWLAPGIGPVKFRRATGRVDELTKAPMAPR